MPGNAAKWRLMNGDKAASGEAHSQGKFTAWGLTARAVKVRCLLSSLSYSEPGLLGFGTARVHCVQRCMWHPLFSNARSSFT